MSSKKPSARAKRVETFKSQLRDTNEENDPFALEKVRQTKGSEQREAAKRKKACESKNRYASRADAQVAIDMCAEYGTRDLHYYRCPYCNGWHITSKKEIHKDDE